MSFSLVNPPPDWPKELVARLMPDPKLAKKETIVQRAVAAAGFPTPAVRAVGGPDDGLGRAFMIMDKATGAPLLSGITGISTVSSALGVLRKIPEFLASSMAQLHALTLPDLPKQLADCEIPIIVTQMLTELQQTVTFYERSDLETAAKWLIAHQPTSSNDVVCHGDLHPFNLLADGDHITVLDWSATLLGARTYDVAFTSVMLGEPPLLVPDPLRPFIKRVGAGLAKSFVRRYQHHANVQIGADDLAWHQGIVCLRALAEVAGWVRAGIDGDRVGHPWMVSGPAIAQRLSSLLKIPVSAR
jgi:aminoglycoside phosphotransferase (APT) family kinase protein